MQELWKTILYTVNEHSEYGKPFINVVYDDDSPSYIDIMFPNCNWNEWEILEKELKTMVHFIKERIMITSVKGLTE